LESDRSISLNSGYLTRPDRRGHMFCSFLHRNGAERTDSNGALPSRSAKRGRDRVSAICPAFGVRTVEALDGKPAWAPRDCSFGIGLDFGRSDRVELGIYARRPGAGGSSSFRNQRFPGSADSYRALLSCASLSSSSRSAAPALSGSHQWKRLFSHSRLFRAPKLSPSDLNALLSQSACLHA
jgi:hypothetical protein